MKQRPGYIYMITDNRNGKIYIGQTRSFDHRRAQYRNISKTTKRVPHSPIESAIMKCDFDRDFHMEILEYGSYTDNELNQLEIEYIDQYNSQDESIGYNVSPGGNAGSYTDNMRVLMHMKSQLKRSVVSYDMTTGDLFWYWSCASAAEFIPACPENIATVARKFHRISGGRYCVFYANAELTLGYLQKYLIKRKRGIDNLILSKPSRSAYWRLSAKRGYVLVELEAVRKALKYSQHQGIAGSLHLTDAEIDEYIDRERSIFEAYKVPPMSAEDLIWCTTPLYLYDTKTDKLRLYEGGAKELSPILGLGAVNINASVYQRRRLKRRYYVYYTDADRRQRVLSTTAKTAYGPTTEYINGLRKIELL